MELPPPLPPNAPLTPPPPPVPPPSPFPSAPRRPPAPPWTVWMSFLFGPALLLSLIAGFDGGRFHPEALLGFSMIGTLLGLPMIAGLAVATRFFSGPVSRIVGGLVLGVALIVACGAAAFAGCMCIMTGHSGFG